MGVIEVKIPDCLHIKPLMKKIETLIKEEETRWVLFERAVEDLDLTEEDLLALEESAGEGMERRKEEPRIVADTNIGSSLFRVGNRIIESSVSSPSRLLCLR